MLPSQKGVVLVPAPPEVLHELDSMLALLVRVIEKHLGEAFQVDVVLGKVGAHQEVLDRGLKLFAHLEKQFIV